jgi:titin
VDLGWDANPVTDLVTGYNIYRGQSSGGESYLASVGLLDTSYTDSAVQNGVTYYYYVTAVNLNGESGPSNEVSATPGGSPPPPPPPTVPGPPNNLNAAAGNGVVYLTWQAPDSDGGSPIKYYHIYRGTSPDQLSRYATVGNQLSYSDSGVTNGQTYWYQVSAENDVGEGAWSNQASATPQAPPSPPGPPLDLIATAGDGNVRLDWSAPSSDGGSPITNYWFYRVTASWLLSFLVDVPDVRTYLDTGLTNGQRYFYHVTAVNSAGEGPASNEASAVPMSGATIPDPPGGLVANGGDARVSLSWHAPASNGGSPITNYKIYRGTSSGGESWLATVAGDVLTYSDGAVTNGVTYFYYVTAVNIVGESGPSNEASATPTPAATVPDAIRNLTAEPTDGGVKLSWLPPANDGGRPISNYKVYRGTSSGDRSSVTTIGPVGSYTDLGLQNGQRYYYVVSAVNEIGEGPVSNEVNAIPATVPSAPRNLRAIAGDGVVTIQWSGPQSDGGSPVTNYRIYRGTVSGNLAFVTMIGPLDTYADQGRMNDQTYYYQVSAVNRAGEGPRSSEASATPRAGRTVPGAPGSLIATAGNRSVHLEWTAPDSDGGSPILSYWVYRGLDPENLTQFLNTGQPSLTLTDGTVTNGVTYYYEVTAVNAMGEGPRSPLASATPHEGAGGADTTSPKVAITNPPPDQSVPAGPMNVYGTASDDTAVIKVEVSPDGTNWAVAKGTAKWIAQIIVSVGEHMIRARVTDWKGNTGTTAVNVTVGPGPSTAGSPPPNNPTTLTMALAVGSFAVSAGIAWFILDRRRRFWRAVLGVRGPSKGPGRAGSRTEPGAGGPGPHRLQGSVPDRRPRP